MTDNELEHMDAEQEEREDDFDDLLEAQEHKGFGEDEGEREEAFEDE